MSLVVGFLFVLMGLSLEPIANVLGEVVRCPKVVGTSLKWEC